MSEPKYLVSSADISPCEKYRYELRRVWDPDKKPVLWVMVNPSTADAWDDDPTITRCVGFTRAWGFGGIVVCNLFALRATDPRSLRGHPDPRGPRNDSVLLKHAADAGLTIAGWGSKGGPLGRLIAERAAQVRQVFAAAGRPMHCLTLCRDGQPSHPLMLPAKLTPVPLPPLNGEG